MRSIREIPEIALLDSKAAQIRIPAELDVPLSPRISRLIDTPAFQRLKKISQLGLVGLVYPAANHTRFEHALGVYRLALLYLRRLSYDPRFSSLVSSECAELLIVAALLHDLGHWPFCQPIEDIAADQDLPPTRALSRPSFLMPTAANCQSVLTRRLGISEPDEVLATLLSEPRPIQQPDQQIACVRFSPAQSTSTRWII